MASQAEVSAVEIYTSMEPVMAKHIEYKGMLLASKVKSRNMFSDIGSGEAKAGPIWFKQNKVFQD